jgi:hypothetical protein
MGDDEMMFECRPFMMPARHIREATDGELATAVRKFYEREVALMAAAIAVGFGTAAADLYRAGFEGAVVEAVIKLREHGHVAETVTLTGLLRWNI